MRSARGTSFKFDGSCVFAASNITSISFTAASARALAAGSSIDKLTVFMLFLMPIIRSEKSGPSESVAGGLAADVMAKIEAKAIRQYEQSLAGAFIKNPKRDGQRGNGELT